MPRIVTFFVPALGYGPNRQTLPFLADNAENLGGDSTFRERVPGARAWSSGNASDGRGGGGGGRGGSAGDEQALPLTYEAVSPGGIRAKSRYVFPDGSVRSGLGTAGTDDVALSEEQGGAADTRYRLGDGDIGGMRAGGGEKKGGSVPLTRVGRSRIESVNLSAALGIDALGVVALGGGGGGETLGRQDTGGGSRGRNHGAYRGPGAAAGSEWAPGGRPPRAFVPFLNLPAFDAKGGSGNGRRRRKQGEDNTDGADGVGSPALPSYVGVGDPPSQMQRGRPLVGVGGVPVSPGRAMLTCLLYTSPSPRDQRGSRMPSSA